ncbi:MAG: hypothetical protein IPI41_17385 [Flavobacteriales bacterium]|nr:hypothetical protein [Flavobacteriales bacterium]
MRPPSATSACAGSTIDLTGSATNLPTTLLSNNFNSGLNGWSTVNSSTGGNPADAAWTLRPNGYFYNASSGADPTFNSNDNTQFLLSNSDDQGSGGTTATVLKSPGFNTEGYTALSLTYFHHYRFNSGATDRGYVEVSTDDQNWTTVQTHSSTQGAANGFVSANVNLNAYTGERGALHTFPLCGHLRLVVGDRQRDPDRDTRRAYVGLDLHACRLHLHQPEPDRCDGHANAYLHCDRDLHERMQRERDNRERYRHHRAQCGYEWHPGHL